MHGLLEELFISLRLHELERVVHRLILIQLVVTHLTVVKLFVVETNDAFDIIHLEVDLRLLELDRLPGE